MLDKHLLYRVRQLDRQSLRELGSHIHALLGPAVVYQQKSSRCGCEKCKAGGSGHGLYWYAYFTHSGKTHCVYIGKEFMEINPLEIIEQRNKQKSKKMRK